LQTKIEKGKSNKGNGRLKKQKNKNKTKTKTKCQNSEVCSEVFKTVASKLRDIEFTVADDVLASLTAAISVVNSFFLGEMQHSIYHFLSTFHFP